MVHIRFMAVFRLERPSMDACRLAHQIRRICYHIRPLETRHMCSTLHACGFTIFYMFFLQSSIFSKTKKIIFDNNFFFTI